MSGAEAAGGPAGGRKGSAPSPRHRRRADRGSASPPAKLSGAKPPPPPLDDRPVHVAQDSLFSSTSGFDNYRGFLNLCLILLLLSNTRVALENIIKYGILVTPLEWLHVFVQRPNDMPNLALLLLCNAFILAAFGVEKALARGRISERAGLAVYTLLLGTELVLPAAAVTARRPSPITSTLALGAHVCTVLKLASYAHVNAACRRRRQSGCGDSAADGGRADGARSGTVRYPHNVTVCDVYYFALAPTLCYELNFPRTPRRRKLFLLKRGAESLLISMLMVALAQQWLVPCVLNSLEPFVSMDYGRMAERLLKLAVPNHIVWLMGFYWLFHSTLNFLAELLTFADRQFYRDWWNSETLTYFWSSWNIPVHRWALRHLYKPILAKGYKPATAATAVFFVSAFFHEYLVSVPLHMFRLWAFIGMLGQIPLGTLTAMAPRGSKMGNMLVWLSIILGQPLCILMYYHDWYLINFPEKVAAFRNDTEHLGTRGYFV